MKTQIFWIPLVLLGMAACDIMSLPVQVDPEPSAPVVSSLVVPPNGIAVWLSRSFSALSPSDISEFEEDFLEALLIRQALVTLRYGNQTDTLAPVGSSGIWAGLVSGLVPYMTLELDVYDSLTTDRVHAVTSYIPPVSFDSVAAKRTVVGQDTLTEVSFSFTPPSDNSWFVVHIYALPDTTGWMPGGALPADSLSLSPAGTVLFQQLYKRTDAAGEAVVYSALVQPETPGETLFFSLSHIDEGYFRYLDARRRSGSILSSLVNEPVNHPTNITGGFGYFSAHIPTFRQVNVTALP